MNGNFTFFTFDMMLFADRKPIEKIFKPFEYKCQVMDLELAVIFFSFPFPFPFHSCIKCCVINKILFKFNIAFNIEIYFRMMAASSSNTSGVIMSNFIRLKLERRTGRKWEKVISKYVSLGKNLIFSSNAALLLTKSLSVIR